MKTFRQRTGEKVGETMTVAELKKKLDEFPDDMPVFGAWEGVWGHFEPENFSLETLDWCHPEDRCDCLIIDVEGH